MAISVRTRKRLWTRAGNRCTLCKCLLVESRHAGTDDVIIGEEAHIVSSTTEGPRHRELSPKQIDDYGNLLLLCRNDHHRVDEEDEFYTEALLREVKQRHESWIERTLDHAMGGKKSLSDSFADSVLHRLRTGAQVVELTYGTFATSWGKPTDLGNKAVAAGEFADFVNEVSNVLPSMSLELQAKAEVVLTHRIGQLEAAGLFLYGRQLRCMASVPSGSKELMTAVFRFREVDHEVLIDLGLVPRELLLA